MKENVAFNEQFCQFHVELEKQKVSYPEIRKQALKHFASALAKGKDKSLSEVKHSYRATIDRLANPKKYGGKYAFMSRFQLTKKSEVAVAS